MSRSCGCRLFIAAMTVALMALAGCSHQQGVADPDGGAAHADGASGDAEADGLPEDQGPPPIPCQVHHDCPQGWICYYKKCVNDPLYPLFHCGKQDEDGNDTCPPGRRCIDEQGKLSVCDESTAYACKDACDCGPAHCCVEVPKLGKRCVKDTADPFLPGGMALEGAGCVPGKDATYCFDDPVCEEARQSYIDAGLEHTFLSFNRALSTVSDRCGGRRCFGTACNCPPGHACVDLQQQTPAVGRTCHLLSGGFCVSKATAEAVLGIKGSELLDCCSWGCAKGQACDAGWISDRSWAYRRMQGTCGSCGNGTCDPGEYHASCSQDCDCGDGTCAPEEILTCPQDCATCGNFICDAGESATKSWLFQDEKICESDCYCGNGTCDPGEATTCPADCSCGDGICSTEEVCAQDCVCPDSHSYPEKGRVCGDGICSRSGCTDIESCLSCPADCGPCAWELASGTSSAGGPLPAVAKAAAAWGDLDTGIFVLGRTTKGQYFVYTFDGKTWSSLPALGQAAVYSLYLSLWGSSPSDLYVASGSALHHFDGAAWTLIPMSPVPLPPFMVRKVWGRSPTDVYALHFLGLLHYDGNPKQQWDLVHAMSWSISLSENTGDLWGPTGSDELFVAGEISTPQSPAVPAIHRCQVSAKSCSATKVPGPALTGIWGAASGSGLEVFAVSAAPVNPPAPPVLWHYDGNASNTWSAMKVPFPKLPPPPGPQPVPPPPQLQYCSPTDIWGRSASEVYVVGTGGMIMRYDGTAWAQMTSPTTHELTAVWGDDKNVFALVGTTGAILRYDAASAAWTQLSSPGSREIEVMPGAGVWGSSASNVLAVAGGTLLRYDGAAWTDVSLPTTVPLHGVWGSSPSDIFVVGGAIPETGTAGTPPVVLHSDGKTWTQLQPPFGTSGALFDIWGTKSNAFAVGSDAKLWHYDGTAWQSVASSSAQWLTGVHGCGSSSRVAVVGMTSGSYEAQGLVGLYDTATKSWTTTLVPEVTQLLDLRCDAKLGKLIAVGGTRVPDEGGPRPAPCKGVVPKVVSCTTANGSAPSCSVSHELPLRPQDCSTLGGLAGLWDGPSGDLYAVGASGLFLRYDGKTWDQVAADIRTTGVGWGCGDIHGIWGTSTGSDLFLQSPGGVLRLTRPGSGP